MIDWYALGYQHGHDDFMLGIPPLVVALYSGNAEYSRGYYDGYNRQPFRR